MKSDRIDFRIPKDMRARLREWVERQDFPMTESAAIRYAILSLLKFSDRVRREGVGE
jgi:Arc/MetJ-type ribon-helix-helix transcriptional regulator